MVSLYLQLQSKRFSRVKEEKKNALEQNVCFK